MKKVFAILILFTAIAAIASDDKWIPRSVQILMTKSERDDTKKPKTDAEQDQFLKNFWAKWDPNPATPENEFKNEWEKAMQQVDGMKIPSLKRKGSDTDMGEVLLLLGKPSDQKTIEPKVSGSTYEDESGAQVQSAQARKKQIWTFHGLPAELGIGDTVIEFFADEDTGEWRFSDAKKAESVLDHARDGRLRMAKEGKTVAAPQQVETPKPAQTGETQGIKAGGQVTSPEVKAALDAAAAGNLSSAISFEVIADGFSTSQQQGFITIATLSPANVANAKVGIRIMDSSGAAVTETEALYTQAGEQSGYFQTHLVVPAVGSYTALVVVTSGNQSGSKKVTTTVPDAAKFSLSSIILSSKFAQLTEPKLEKEPYTFGKIKLTPSLNHQFTEQDNLIIVYEAYNFQIDPATKQQNLESSYEFQKEGEKPKAAPAVPAKGPVTGKKILISGSFPLATFPPGKYTVTVHLTDKATNQTLTERTPFTVTK